MNKYTSAGIVEAARNGRRFLIVNKDVGTSREVFGMCRTLATTAAKVHAANGQEAIHWDNGGMIAFIGLNRTAGRGYSADTLYIDTGCADMMSDTHWEALLPTISGSPTGEVVEAQ